MLALCASAPAVDDAAIFDLELEVVRLRAMLAVDQDHAVSAPRLAAELARISADLEAMRPVGRMARLANRLCLSPEEVDLVWSAVAIAMDPHTIQHAKTLGGEEARRGLTLSLHAVLAGLSTARARALTRQMSETHPLFREHILAWANDERVPSARPIAVAPAVVSWLAGEDVLAPTSVVVQPPGELLLDAAQGARLDELPSLLAMSSALVIVEGAVGSGRRTAIAGAARGLGRAVIALDASRLPNARSALCEALDDLRRDCLLRDAIPVIADLDELACGDADRADIARLLGRAIDAWSGVVVVTVRGQMHELPLARPFVRLRWSTPDRETRRELWARAVGPTTATSSDLDQLAVRYRMGAGGIRRAAASARLGASRRDLATPDLVAGVRAHVAERFGELAQRQEVRQTWDDLFLPPDLADQVRSFVLRVRHEQRVLDEWGFGAKVPKGRGVAALFSGPPGTGKTMVAGLIARELDLELYQVDLSKVVSKWVGETEKQLARVFDAAEAGHALLLFDEADALFARRTEVKAAVDRYANLEVNYLLQRIESFGGVAILTTNLETSIDPALRRRLAASITFWGPDVREREALWRRMLAVDAPVAGDVDFAALADSFDKLTGATIRNAVLAAAFDAAGDGSSITHAHLVRAARREYASMGRVLAKH